MNYREVYSDSLLNGIGLFSTISNNSNVPWSDAPDDNKKLLEQSFSLLHGNKTLLDSFISLSPEDRANAIVTFFAGKWEKLWNAYQIEYGLVDAYVLTEEGNSTKRDTWLESTEYGKVITEQGSNSGTIGTASDATSSDHEGIFGFNSATSVGSGTSTGNETSNETETRNLTDTRNTSHGGIDSKNGNNNNVEEHSLTKKGNIGYTTPQEMIKQELELWGDPFFAVVFSDIVRFCMYQVY